MSSAELLISPPAAPLAAPSTGPPQTTRRATPEPFLWPEALALSAALALVSLLLTGWVRPLDLLPW